MSEALLDKKFGYWQKLENLYISTEEFLKEIKELK